MARSKIIGSKSFGNLPGFVSKMVSGPLLDFVEPYFINKNMNVVVVGQSVCYQSSCITAC